MESDLLQSSITLLVGLLIFFTIRHFQLFDYRSVRGKEGETKRYPVSQARILLATLIGSVLSIMFSLFEFDITISLAKLSIFGTLIALIILIIDILRTSPSAANTGLVPEHKR
jgi:hypothetical protein